MRDWLELYGAPAPPTVGGHDAGIGVGGHRMLHRGPQLLSVDALRAIVERQMSEKAETGKS